MQDVTSIGYLEEEYFFSGEATSYALSSGVAHDPDGMWSVEEDATAPYTTRMIVRRPIDAEDFSGTVLVEWLNVSSGRDLEAEWPYMVDEIVREGHAWVGVSAQSVSVHGGVTTGAELDGGLAGSDPERYGSLSHPGDAYSFDIFTQAGRAVSSPDGPAPLGDLVPAQLIGSGVSQSAAFLTTYVNAAHPLAAVYDGFFIHARGSGAPQLNGYAVANPVLVRSDLGVPVFIFETETDVTSTLGAYHAARQEDTASLRTWEVAGTAHVDEYAVDLLGWRDDPAMSTIVDCDGPAFNDGPHHEVAQAALHHLVGWLGGGASPPGGRPARPRRAAVGDRAGRARQRGRRRAHAAGRRACGDADRRTHVVRTRRFLSRLRGDDPLRQRDVGLAVPLRGRLPRGLHRVH